MNNIKNKLSKTLTNNYIFLVLVSYIYLIIKINNNNFKEFLTYIISVLLFYSYFKNLRYSYIFGFFVLLIRYVYKEFFKYTENFKKNKNKDDEEGKIIDDIDKQAKSSEEDLTTEPVPSIDSGLSEEELGEIEEDDNKKDSYIKSSEKSVNDSVDNADLGITI
jgi:hypothetical protein